MNNRWLGITALVLLSLITLWLALLSWDVSVNPPIESPVQAAAIGERIDWRFRLTYANAVLFTLVTTALMAGLYLECWEASPVWALVGLLFVPVYATLNLVAYGSQITVAPVLVELANGLPSESAELLLSMMVHLWPGSMMAMINGLAYAVLGIPSIIFGLALVHRGPVAKTAGALLASSGLASMIGFAGMVVDAPALALGTLIGGGLFWLALFSLTWVYWRRD